MRGVLLFALAVLAFSAVAREWFDGGINRHWPDLARGGEWTDGGGYFCEGFVRLDSELESPAVFEARDVGQPPQSAQAAHVVTEMVFGFRKELPDPSEVGRAAVTVLKRGDGQYVYHVLERDGATNRWAAVAGTPDVTNRCSVAFDFMPTATGLQVTYGVDGVTLAVKEVVGTSIPTEVCYAGGGDLALLSGTYETDMARFELQMAAGCLVGVVSVGGSQLTYPYEVTVGTQVTVEYHAYGNCCFPNGETSVTKTFTINTDGQSIPVPPEAVPASAVARVKDDRFPSLGSAFAAVRDGDTVTMLADCTNVTALTLANRGNVTLDLNGHVVEGDGNGPFVTVSGATTLTVVNGDMTRTDSLRQLSGATLVSVNGGAVVLDGRYCGGLSDDGAGAVFQCAGNGSVTVNGGAVFGRLDGSGFAVAVYTNGDRFASARFTQDESAWLAGPAKVKRMGMTPAADGLWSMDSLLKQGMTILIR